MDPKLVGHSHDNVPPRSSLLDDIRHRISGHCTKEPREWHSNFVCRLWNAGRENCRFNPRHVRHVCSESNSPAHNHQEHDNAPNAPQAPTPFKRRPGPPRTPQSAKYSEVTVAFPSWSKFAYDDEDGEFIHELVKTG
jgi:hypothetical protein